MNSESERKDSMYLYIAQYISNYFILVFAIPGFFNNWFRKSFLITDHLAFLFVFLSDMFSFFMGYIVLKGVKTQKNFILSSLILRSALFTVILYTSEFTPVIFYFIRLLLTFRIIIRTIPDSFKEKLEELNIPLNKLSQWIQDSSFYNEIISILDLLHLSCIFIYSLFTLNIRLLLVGLFYGFIFIPLLYYTKAGHRIVWKKISDKLTEFEFGNRTFGKYVMRAIERFQYVIDVAQFFVPLSILNKN